MQHKLLFSLGFTAKNVHMITPPPHLDCVDRPAFFPRFVAKVQFTPLYAISLKHFIYVGTRTVCIVVYTSIEIKKVQVPFHFFESFSCRKDNMLYGRGERGIAAEKWHFVSFFPWGWGGGTSLYGSLKEELLWESGSLWAFFLFCRWEVGGGGEGGGGRNFSCGRRKDEVL